MSMYMSIGTTIANMEDAYGTANVDTRLERIARPEPLSTRAAGLLRRTAGALLSTAATLDHQRGTGVGHGFQTAT
jgi:hypothetical protein